MWTQKFRSDYITALPLNVRRLLHPRIFLHHGFMPQQGVESTHISFLGMCGFQTHREYLSCFFFGLPFFILGCNAETVFFCTLRHDAWKFIVVVVFLLGAGVFFVAFSTIIFAFGWNRLRFFPEICGHRCGERPANLWCCLVASLASSHVRQHFLLAGGGGRPATSGQANAYDRLRATRGVQLLPFAILLCVQS